MAKQEEIPEVMKRVPKIEEAASEYVKVRDKRMKMAAQEVEARTTLIDAMRGAKVETYKTLEGLLCILTTTEKVKVKSPSDDDGEE